MSAVSVNIRIDKELKRAFEDFCDDVGLSMTSAFLLFAKKTVRENRIPFEIDRGVPNAETLKAMEESREITSNPSAYKSFSSAEEMFKDIFADE